MFYSVSDDSAHALYNTQNDDKPERLLMVAVLERAYRDLTTLGDHPENRTTAIEWFQNNDQEYIFSYQSIKSHVEICPGILREIEDTLARAIKAEGIFKSESKQEGQASRISDSKLDESKWDCDC